MPNHLVYRPGHGFYVGHEYTGGIEGGPTYSRNPVDALFLKTDPGTAAHNLTMVRHEHGDAVRVELSDDEVGSWAGLSPDEVLAWEAAMEVIGS